MAWGKWNGTVVDDAAFVGMLLLFTTLGVLIGAGITGQQLNTALIGLIALSHINFWLLYYFYWNVKNRRR